MKKTCGLFQAMMIIEAEEECKEDYIRAWKEGMRHLHWFKESKLFDYNWHEMIEEISRDFGEPESVFLMAKLAKNEKTLGVLGIKLQEDVGVLRRWEPAVPLKERSSGAGQALIERGFQWLRQRGIQKAVCLLKYPYNAPEAADWHVDLYEKGGFKQRGPISVQLLADLSYTVNEKPVHTPHLTVTTSERYTLENLADFVLKAYATTPEDRAIHGWDPFVSIPDEILKGLQSIKQGKYGLSPPECWKIAMVEGEPAGFIISFMPEDRYRPSYGVIGLIGVFPEFRRRGIAYNLVLGMHKYFRTCGCRYAYVGTPKTNEKAINLYRKAGYRPVFKLVNFEKQL